MNFPVVSPEQKTVLDRLNQVRTIRYTDQSIALETILRSVIQLMSEGQKCILVSSNEAILNSFYNLLAEYSLQHMSLAFNPGKNVLNTDIQYITKCISEQVQSYQNNVMPVHEGKLSGLRRVTSECISEIYLSEELYSYRNILKKLAGIPQDIESNLLQLHLSDSFMSLEESEFENQLNMVIKASTMYHLSYENGLFISFVKMIHSHWYQDEDRRSALLIKLNDYITELNTIRNHYYSALATEYQEELILHEQKYTDLFSDVEELKWMCFHYSEKLETDSLNQGIFNLFSREDKGLQKYKNEILKKFKQLKDNFEKDTIKFNDDIILTEFDKQLNKLNSFFEKAEISLEKWFHAEKLKLKNQHKFFNKFNFTKNQSVTNLEKELVYVLDRLNAEGFFIDDREINTISIFKQVESVDNLILELASICDLIEHKSDFFEWQYFIDQQNDHGKKLFAVLKHLPPSTWPDAFTKWYYETWLRKNRNPFTARLETMIRQIYEFETDQISVASDAICRNQYHQSNVFNQQLKTSFQELYKVLYKNKTPDELVWRYFFEKYASPLSWYFNLIISSDDSFSDIPDGLYEHVFYIAYDNINPDVLGIAKTVHTYLPLENGKTSQDELPLTLPTKQIAGSESENNPTVQLETAKYLTSLLTSCKPEVSVFQLKNSNIISCLSGEHNKNILSYNSHKGIKEILRPHAEEELILESCLEKDRKPFLLCENLLLQPSGINEIAWQYYVVSTFSKAGFTVLSLSTADTMEHYHEAIQKLCRQFS